MKIKFNTKNNFPKEMLFTNTIGFDQYTNIIDVDERKIYNEILNNQNVSLSIDCIFDNEVIYNRKIIIPNITNFTDIIYGFNIYLLLEKIYNYHLSENYKDYQYKISYIDNRKEVFPNINTILSSSNNIDIYQINDKYLLLKIIDNMYYTIPISNYKYISKIFYIEISIMHNNENEYMYYYGPNALESLCILNIYLVLSLYKEFPEFPYPFNYDNNSSYVKISYKLLDLYSVYTFDIKFDSNTGRMVIENSDDYSIKYIYYTKLIDILINDIKYRYKKEGS